ncbi:MAG: hypothetical protein HKN18_07095 [Silicimonas sp.]|nr:hypothetical protein [Silicimonas sp.]
MIVTLLLGLAAGWGAAFAEDHLRGILARALSVEPISFQPVEMRAISLTLCLLAAALLSWLFATPNAVALTLGAVIGVAAPRLRDRIRAARAPDYDG